MNELHHHEMASIFPMMTGKELSVLAEDIKANGLQNPIILHDGKILDGRNRYEACRIAGKEPDFVNYTGDDPFRFIISLNLHRRHLDESQRAVIASRVANMTQGARTDLEPSANLRNVISQPEAARMFNVSERMIQTVKAIEREAPERIADIEAGNMTATKVYKLLKREAVHDSGIEQDLPSGKYRVFYADPPWQYGNSGLDEYGHAERHYPTMSIPEICNIPVNEMADDNAVLFLWVTSPFLEDAFKIIKAWGFEYKTSFVWDKVKHNFGYYNSVRHEFLLVCTKGSCLPDIKEKFDSVISIERSEKHSEKPEHFRKLINTLYPHGKRIELFSRTKCDGWDVWGNAI